MSITISTISEETNDHDKRENSEKKTENGNLERKTSPKSPEIQMEGLLHGIGLDLTTVEKQQKPQGLEENSRGNMQFLMRN